MKRRLVAVGATLLVLMAEAGTVAPASFAQRYTLTLSGSAAYYRLTLPPQVYAASQRSDLGDLRILNGAGESLPFSLESPSAPAPLRRAVLTPLNWFAVPTTGEATDRARLGVSLDANGTLHAEVGAPTGKKRNGDAVLVDLGNDGEVAALWVRLRNERYQGQVLVEASNDLNQWQSVAEAVLLKASAGDKRLAQERLALDGVRRRYLRLSWPDGAPEIAAIEAEAIVLEAVADAQPAPLLWHASAPVRAGDSAGEYLFDSGGAYPVESLRVDLPQGNTIAKVSIQSRDDLRAAWRDVGAGTVFRLQGKKGEEVSSPLRLNAMPSRYWRMQVDMRNGGIGREMPKVMLGWRPAMLTFVARGSPPFTLGIGNATLTSAAQRREDLLMGEHPEIGNASVEALLTTVVKQQTVTAPDNTRKPVLWVGLIIAVAALGAIAWRLARSTVSADKAG